MRQWFFATDLHGRRNRYEALLEIIAAERPAAVLLGGDLLPHVRSSAEFTSGYLMPQFAEIRARLGEQYPAIFLILGNDDLRLEEGHIVNGEMQGLWRYAHSRILPFEEFLICGYACVPPTPFLFKDWERYDVSRYVDPGCVSPEEGNRSVAASAHETRWGTIREDLEALTNGVELHRAVCLFHAPPYDTPLDRAALDGKMYEYVPLDVHIGSIAVRQFIERRQPLVALHGHVHEAARITGDWKIQIGRTVCINAAHDGPELALVRFDPSSPGDATRELL